MASLFCPPNEVLYTIAAKVYHDDIENFALCNKTIFAISEDVLKEHRSRKKYTRTILKLTINPYLVTAKALRNHPFQLVQELYDDECCALYVSSLYIDASGEEEDNGDDEDVWQEYSETIAKAYRDRIYATLKKIPSLSESMILKELMPKILHGHQGLIVGLILCMLPNLVKLSLRDFPCKKSALSKMMRQIIGYTTDSARASGVLSKLSVLKISQSEEYEPESENLELYECFCGLPSLRKFKGARIEYDLRHSILSSAGFADGC